ISLSAEKRSQIWEHFTIVANPDGQKNAVCNYCGRGFLYKTMSANRCREHLYEKCEKVPESVKSQNKTRFEAQVNKCKFTVWQYFLTADRDGKTIIPCCFCGSSSCSRLDWPLD